LSQNFGYQLTFWLAVRVSRFSRTVGHMGSRPPVSGARLTVQVKYSSPWTSKETKTTFIFLGQQKSRIRFLATAKEKPSYYKCLLCTAFRRYIYILYILHFFSISKYVNKTDKFYSKVKLSPSQKFSKA
jgi:hypothetical protein